MSIHSAFDFLIQWHLTERCNLRCSHCYQNDTRTVDLTTVEIRDTVQEISETLKSWKERYNLKFSPSVNITGGEPFLRTDLFEILEEFHVIGFDIHVLTNGILIDKKRAGRLFKAGVKGVQVSIEGPEAIHDSIRGAHSFSASLKGVKHLLDAGLPVTLNVTLSRLNADYLTDTIKIAMDYGVHRVGFSRLVPSGRGKNLIDKMLRTEAVMRLYDTLFMSGPSGKTEIVTGDPVASQFRNKLTDTDFGDIALGGCAAGISGLTIMPDGTMLPCRRMPIPLGNVRIDSFREVWAMSDVLNDLRDRSKYKGKCGSCNKWAHCRGCRAIAYAYSQALGKGDYLAPDPQCFI
jgi:radical SAM protein with 4Fe4S-binding SPASM domain